MTLTNRNWISLWPWSLSAGLISVQFLSALYFWYWLFLAGILSIAWFIVSRANHKGQGLARINALLGLFLLATLGASWGSFVSQQTLDRALPKSLVKKDVWVVGKIQEIPQVRSHAVRFRLDVNSLMYKETKQDFKGEVLLNWYEKPHPALRIGETWKFKVRLKPAHGFLNPGGFDYEKWLFSQGIRASGYVRDAESARLISAATLKDVVGHFRTTIQHFIDNQTLQMPGVIKALSIAQRDGISPEQWKVFRNTGTAHLVAISGLHIGLVAGLAYFLCQFLWRHSLLTLTLFPAQYVGQIGSVIAAIIYAALAGFALPTLRALLMLLVFLGLLALRRNPGKVFTLGLVLAVVLIADPLAPLGMGLWLSFGAVAAIAYVMRHHGSDDSKELTEDIASKKTWRSRVVSYFGSWLRIQWAVFVMLLPLSLLFFGQFSVVSLVANFVAIPVVGFLVVPFILMALLGLSFGWTEVATGLLSLADKVLGLLWPLLTKFSQLPYAYWQSPEPPMWAIWLAIICAVLLLARPFRLKRMVAFFGFIPLFLPATPNINSGHFEIQVLDVGQGLAVLVQTKNHNLLYDAGIKTNSGFDMGDAIVLPFMRQSGAKKLDVAVISHNNIDHYGGMSSVLSDYPQAKRYSSAGFFVKSQPCETSIKWEWDEVKFSFLHPSPENTESGNNDSCVLKISAPSGSALLTGDIEIETEHALLRAVKNELRSDVLLVPHHGSKSSSSAQFIAAVAPKAAIFSAGFLSRFGHPHPKVKARYEKAGVETGNTAHQGWIRIFWINGGVHTQGFRQTNQRYWFNEKMTNTYE